MLASQSLGLSTLNLRTCSSYTSYGKTNQIAYLSEQKGEFILMLRVGSAMLKQIVSLNTKRIN